MHLMLNHWVKTTSYLAYNYRYNRSESDKDTRTQDVNGEYTVLDTTYSRRLENNFLQPKHRVELPRNERKVQLFVWCKYATIEI